MKKMEAKNLGGYKSVNEAAEIIGVSIPTIYNWIRKGFFRDVVWADGFAGHPMQYIAVDEVYGAIGTKWKHKKKVLVVTVEETEGEDNAKKEEKLAGIEEALARLERAVIDLHFRLEELKSL